VCVCVRGARVRVAWVIQSGGVSSSIWFNRLYIFAPGGQTMNVVYQKALQ
jgi:hypothetical protein